MNMVYYIGFLILLFIGSAMVWTISEKSTSKLRHCSMIIVLLLGISGIFLSEAYYSKRPRAIDVYRNKTELVITETLKNGIIIKQDSIVEFK